MSAPWDRRSADERRRAERLLLRDWLPAATTFSPYWARRRAALDAAPGDLTDRAGLRRLRPVRERDLLAAGGEGAPDLLMRPDEDQLKARADGGLLLSVARATRRGGAEGKREAILTEYKPLQLHRAGLSEGLAIAYSRSDLDRLHRCGARAAAVLGLQPHDCLLSAVPAGPTLAFWGVYHLALGASMLALHPRGGGAGLTDVLDELALTPATAVAVPRAEAARLGSLAAERGVDCGRVSTVVTVGPPPAEARRDEIAAAWGAAVGGEVAVRALWAPGEARALWAECAEGGHGLHTYPDLEVLEVLDPVGGRPADGAGDLTYTSAGWHGTALLRYRTGTHVGPLETDPCPGCGRTVPRLTGRLAPAAWQPLVDVGDDRTARLDLRGVAAALTNRGIDPWRVELTTGTATDEITVEVAGDVPDREALAGEVARAAGVWPTRVHVADAPDAVHASIEAAGGRFVDRR